MASKSNANATNPNSPTSPSSECPTQLVFKTQSRFADKRLSNWSSSSFCSKHLDGFIPSLVLARVEHLRMTIFRVITYKLRNRDSTSSEPAPRDRNNETRLAKYEGLLQANGGTAKGLTKEAVLEAIKDLAGEEQILFDEKNELKVFTETADIWEKEGKVMIHPDFPDARSQEGDRDRFFKLRVLSMLCLEQAKEEFELHGFKNNVIPEKEGVSALKAYYDTL